MKKITMVLVPTILMLVLGGSLFTAAYTSVSMERDANVNVVADDQGIVELNPGSVSFVELVDGELLIDVTNGGAQGVNVESTLLVGDSNNPTTENAFSVVNSDTNERTMNFEYLVNDSNTPSDGIQFTAFDSTGAQIDQFQGGENVDITLSSGEEIYFVMEVNTEGMTEQDDLSGTLNIQSQ